MLELVSAARLLYNMCWSSSWGSRKRQAAASLHCVAPHTHTIIINLQLHSPIPSATLVASPSAPLCPLALRGPLLEARLAACISYSYYFISITTLNICSGADLVYTYNRQCTVYSLLLHCVQSCRRSPTWGG